MRTTPFLAMAVAGLLPLTLSAHENFLNPHIHAHSHGGHEGHDHSGHDLDHSGHDHSGHDQSAHGKGASKKQVVMAPTHLEEDPARIHVTTGLRYTEYDTHEGDANLWETGLGLALDVNSWLQLTADARYGWFESDFADEEGWLPASIGIETHFPVAEHWEVGTGFRVQFPGEEPLGADEWELSPEFEVRYDRGTWYAGLLTEVSWVLYQGDHDHGHEDHEEEPHEVDHHDEDDHGHEAHEEEHADIHEIIEPHGETEFTWQASVGARLLEERLTLEARIKGYHVIQGDTEEDHFLRAGARGIYAITDGLTVIGDASIPITDARRNEWQTSVALRVSF